MQMSERAPAPGPQLDTSAAAERTWAPRWWTVFAVGLLLWLGAVAATYITADVLLLPTVVLLGSFLVPVTAVVWYLDHDPSPALSPRRILLAFIVAGPVGVMATATLEYYLVSTGLIGNVEVGVIEEFVKAVLIVVVALGIGSFRTRDGMVLGAAVGFGFAALESSGYALASLFVVAGHHIVLSLSSVVTTELVRGVLAPFAHGLWSAIVGGALFSAARHRGRLGWSWTVAVAFLGVAALHAAFDTTASVAGYVLVSVVGLIPLVAIWWRSDPGGAATPRSLPLGGTRVREGGIAS